ncbi:MAG: ComEC/Rec2 family competence protein [Chryseolinea sp.]
MVAWIPYPFVRIVVFFIAGILFGIYLPDIIDETFAQFTLSTFVILYIVLFFISQKRIKINLGFLGLTTIFLAGYVQLLSQTESRQADHFIHFSKPIEYYKAVVTKYAEEKDKSWKLEVNLTELKSEGKWKIGEGKIVCYFPKEDFKKPFQYGDVLLVKGNPQIVQPPSNPGEFDYQRFLTFRNIYHQHFIKRENVKWLQNNPPNYFLYYSIKARSWADSTLYANVIGEREQAIASALVLGVTDGLDNELLSAYSATGAMHVLAVSGLHVGIIYWIILLLFKPLTKSKSGEWTLAVLSFIILWSYAFVTGLSPSVLRAVAMFSVVAIARPANQRTNIYNTLAAAAFLLLVYEPFFIMSVGFQLSFLAVLGIVYLQPALYAWWEPRARFWDEVWKITCVSIAAQAATFSLGLLYFHQFPNYFLISNLFVIPISFGVLVDGLLVLAVGFFHPLASFFGLILEWFIKAMNFVVFTVEDFPFSLVENIYINTFQCWMIMLLIIVIILLLEYKKFSYLITSVCLSFVVGISSWIHFVEDVDTERLILYKVAHHNAFDLIDHGQALFFTDSVLYNDREKLRFHIQPNRLIGGVSTIQPGYEKLDNITKKDGCTLLVWKQKTILILNQRTFTLPNNLKVDYLIISQNAIKDLTSIQNHIQTDKVIFDSSNSFYYVDKMLKQANELHMNVYSVLHDGAFEVKT